MAGPGLEDLIDLEVQLARDADATPERLMARDAEIGGRTGAVELADREALLAWIDAMREQSDLPGAVSLRLHERLTVGLILGGFAIGALGVAGWLATGSREPVNVVYFWPVFVGVQAVLAVLFPIVLFPERTTERIPLIRSLIDALRGLSALIPRLVGPLLRRLSSEGGERLDLVLSELRRHGRLYGRVRFWVAASLTQVFALSFNVGAVAAFVLLPTIDDPAFGWRSRLLDEETVIETASLVSTPWKQIYPEAVPSQAVVSATRYSSVDERYGDRAGEPGDGAPWHAWWPFLCASLVVYGLMPRFAYLIVTRLGLRRALAKVEFERVETARVLARLRRPLISTQALEAESGARIDHGPATTAMLHLGEGAALLLCWEGVRCDPGATGALLERRFGADVRETLSVGGRDASADELALKRVGELDSETGLYLMVGAWEPPVGDYVDFIDALRAAAGPSRIIMVVLQRLDAEGGLCAPSDEEVRVWRRRLARLGDPKLGVEPLLPGGPDAAERRASSEVAHE